MKELSLHILDIAVNSLRAGAARIEIMVTEHDGALELSILDDGCGMTSDESARLISRSGYTTKAVKNGAGQGFSLLCRLAESTGGYVTVDSAARSSGELHGTRVFAKFYKNSANFLPMGDIAETLFAIISGNPDIDLRFVHESEVDSVEISTLEMRNRLGNIPLTDFRALELIRCTLAEKYAECENLST